MSSDASNSRLLRTPWYSAARRVALALLPASGCLVSPLRTAHAADEDATTGMARERFKEGVSYFDKKEYEQGMQEYATALTQWRTAKQPREKLTEAIASVKSMLEKAGQKQYAKVWEDEATQLIR